MNHLGSRAVEPRIGSGVRFLTAVFCTLVLALALFALTAARANAAFSITGWALTPSTTQAGGHPNVSYHLDPDAVAGDQTGDDLKTVMVELPAGMLANPASISTPCTATQFSQDKCPTSTQIGTLSVQYRKNGSYFTMPGTAYEITADPSSVMTVGFIVRPSGFQKIFLKSSKVAGIATVRTGIDADYGVNVTFDNIPRTLTSTLGAVTNVTISDITVNLQSKSKSTSSGPYFTFNPTRCTAASTRATMTSYLGVVIQKTSSFTPTGCASVPFAPTFSATPSSKVSGAAIGLSATVTVPTADATIQQSHVQNITTTLGTGTTLNFPNISAVGALCTDAQLGADSCPAASQIGTSSVAVPFLPPTMTGAIYLMGRSSSITFGYTLHGSGGTLVTLKGSATAVDLNNDGVADAVRAYLINLPQAPFSSATLNFTSQLINNPQCTGAADSAQTVSAVIGGYSGASASKSVNYSLTGCNAVPDTAITSGPASPTSNATPSFAFSSATSGATFQCSLDGSAFAACSSPYTTSTLADGSHNFQVRAVLNGTVDPTPASATFVVDTTAPVVMINSLTASGTSLTASFTAADANGIAGTNCSLDSAAAAPCTSPVTYSGLTPGGHTITVIATDQAGNAGSAAATYVPPLPPTITIGTPANGAFIPSTSVTVAFATTNSPTSTTCQLDAGAPAPCASPTTYNGLAQGSHTVVVSASNAGGTGTASVNFTVDSVLPVVNITSPANGAIFNTPNVTASFTVTDATATTTTCALDSGAPAPCATGQAYTALPVGAHTFTVCATDQAANMGCSSSSFTIAETQPIVTITAPLNGAALRLASTIDATFTVSSPLSTTTTCKIDANAAVACSSPFPMTGLSVGSHTLTVSATDSAGNVGTSSSSFTLCACAPGVTITSPTNGAYLATTSPTVTFSLGSGATGTTCQLDGGTAAACTSPTTYSGLSQGSHTMTVATTDSFGPTSASVSFNVDTIPPVINLCSGGPIYVNSINPPVCFIVTDASPVTVTCRVDGGATVACTSPWTPSVLSQGSHTITICATDAAGNSSCLTWTFTVDTVPPNVVITSPVNGSTVGSSSVSVAFTATDATTSVTGSTCKLDSAAATPCTSPFAYTGLVLGSHTIQVCATDAADNTGCSTTTFAYTIISPPNPTCTVSGNSVTCTWTPQSGVTYSCSLDGGAATACTPPKTYTGLASGTHTFTLIGVDSSGNVGSASVTFTIQSLPNPNPTCNVSGSSVTCTWTVQAGTTYACSLDGAAAQTCTPPKTYTGLASGPHTFTLIATNAAGSGTATLSFVIGGPPPVVTIITPANGSVTGPSVTLNFSVSVSPVTTTCKLDSNPGTACTPPVTYSGLAVGTHTITVTATDASGNTGSATTTFTVVAVPVVTITSPSEGALLATTTPTVTFTFTGAPTSVTCRIDAAAAAACTSPYTPPALAQGSHSLQICATNAAGTGCKTVNFSVDTIPPVVTITSPPNGTTTGATVSVSFTAIDATTVVTGYTCAVDGAPAVACTNPYTINSLSDGVHAVRVSATDSAGNVGSAVVSFTVSTGGGNPVVITSPAEGAYIGSTSVNVTFTGSGSLGVTCSLDGAAPTSCTSPVAYSTLTQGHHCVVVTANDVSNTSSATRCFFVDTVTPGITSTGFNPTTFTATDASPIVAFACTIDGSPYTPCSSPWTTPVLPPGTHTVSMCATDAAGNTGCSNVTFTVLAPPTVSIVAPAEGSYVPTTTPSFTWSTTGVATSALCTIDGGGQFGCASGYAGSTLGQGAHTFTVCVSNSAGSACDTRHFTVDSIPPVVIITNPANGAFVPATGSVNATFTVTDASPVSVTCSVDAGSAASCTSPFTISGLTLGTHTLKVCATDPAGNTTCAISTFTYGGDPGPVVITSAPGPATASQTPTYTFSASGATTYTCSVDGGAASACTSPFTAPTLSDQAIHTLTVSAVNTFGTTSASSSTWVDTSAYGVSATLAQLPNSITTAANVSAPDAHPNVESVVSIRGATDTKNATLTLPHGLEGSLASIPDPSSDTASTTRRCSISEANAGTCPSSSIVGQGSGTIVTTDSSTPLAVTGTAYLTDAPTSTDAAGIAMKATVPGGRGDIIATGAVDLINNGATVQATATNLPTSTTLGVAFHATALDVTLNGDTGGSAHPLITNPSYCFTPTPATGVFGPYNPSTNPTGYIGQFGSIVGSATAYDSSTATTTTPYPVTGCSNSVAPFAPTMSQTLISSTPGTSTAAIATVSLPQDNSSIVRILSKEPAKLGPNTSAYGNSTDMCPSSSVVSTGSVGVGNQPFNISSCPAQARIGQVRIVSPLLDSSGIAGDKKGTGDGQIVGDVYLINKSPLPWLGIHVDPTIAYPGRGVNGDGVALKNPQGVTANLLATTATPTVHPTCSSINGDANCGLGQPNCDTDTQFCQTQISVTVPNIPDLPITSTTLYLGVLGDGTTAPPGRVGTGGITSNNPLNVITAGDNTCATGIDPNTTGADTGGGTPFSSNVTGQFSAWSRINATGGALAGTTLVSASQAVGTPGC